MNNLYRLSAFPKSPNGGNQAGVYLNADQLSDTQMQRIAKELGYSETAFVMKSDIADYKVRFFTPTTEVDLCGHATIATFNLLRDLEILKPGLYKQETKAGVLNINITKDMVFMQQQAPFFGQIISYQALKPVLGSTALNQDFKPQIISTGLREIFVSVNNQKTLNQLKPNFDEMKKLCQQYQVIGIHVFCIHHDVDAYGRNFAPILGIDEESATGTSNGALACYLHQHNNDQTQYIFRQGYSMNKPSEIKVNLTTSINKISEVWVGGKALIIKQ